MTCLLSWLIHFLSLFSAPASLHPPIIQNSCINASVSDEKMTNLSKLLICVSLTVTPLYVINALLYETSLHHSIHYLRCKIHTIMIQNTMCVVRWEIIMRMCIFPFNNTPYLPPLFPLFLPLLFPPSPLSLPPSPSLTSFPPYYVSCYSQLLEQSLKHCCCPSLTRLVLCIVQ